MAFPYKNMEQLVANWGSETATYVDHVAEMTSEAEVTAAHWTVRTTIASSTADHYTVTLEDGAAAGTGTTAMTSGLGGVSSVMTALTTRDFTVSEGTINDADQINANVVEAGTATIIGQLDLEFVRGLPAGAA